MVDEKRKILSLPLIGSKGRMPEEPPMTADQAELFVLSKCPPGGVFFLPCGARMEPIMVQAAFERLLMAEHVKLFDVTMATVPDPRTGQPVNVLSRYFKVSEEGVRRLAILRTNVQLN